MNKEGLIKSILKYSIDNRVALSIACTKFGKHRKYVSDYIYLLNKNIKEPFQNSAEKEILSLYNNKKIGFSLGCYIENVKFIEKDTIKKDNLRNTPGTYFITGCTHAPWHNKKMYDSVLKYLTEKVKLQGIILAGDFLDLNSLSSHDRGKIPLKGVTLDWEYREANKLLDLFDELDIKGTKDYLFGNHCDRYNRLLSNSDESKYGEALKSPEEGLRLLERGYCVYKDWKNDSIKLGEHLEICHGEFLNTHSAKKTIDTYRKSVLYFHTHRFQIYIEGLVGGFNMGFGGDINAPIFNYATKAMKNSWLNACCLVTLDKDGFYHVEPLFYINNRLIVNGKEY